MATSAVVINDTLKVSSQDVAHASLQGTLASTLRVTNVATPRRSTAGLLRSTLRISSPLSAASQYGLTLRSTLKLAVRRLSAGLGARLHSTLTLTPRQQLTQATALRSVLRLATHTTLVAHYQLGLRDRLKLTAIGPGYARLVYLHSTMALHASLTKTYKAVAKLGSTLEMVSHLAPHLVVVVAHADTLEIHDADVLRMLYAGQLTDTVDFAIDVFDPGGDVTTWAMNARTGAVTEYLNYGFNAFAQASSGLYLGAGSDGLYELAGSDDAGTPVIADIISGLADFGGSFLSGFKAAYLAVRGNGQFFLKLTSGSGASTVYGVNATTLKTSRVNMGKGIRARYFTFELVSTGQDFDLADLTFLPVQSTRRV